MRISIWSRLLALCLALICVLGAVGAANLLYDQNQDGKTTVWDLQQTPENDQADALEEVLGGKDELHKNADGHWEIWSALGVFNMAKHAQAGDTFVLMQDVDMNGALWAPVENFNGKLVGNVNTISNFKIADDVDGKMGFFASIAEEGSIEWLNLADMNIVASDDAVTFGLFAGECAGTIHASTAIGFVTDYRTKLPGNMIVGGMVGKLLETGAISTHVENMLPSDQSAEIPNISAKLGMNFATLADDTYTRSFDIVGENAGTLDPMTLLQDATGLIHDPNAMAWVKNGDVTTYPHSLTELLSMINADGNSVVTLQEDLTHNAPIEVPYTSTWDLNGYTIKTNPTSGNCLTFLDAGTDNQITTVKNGTIYHYAMGIRVNKGGVVAQNLKMYGANAPCVGIYDPVSTYNDINLIEDCELYHAIWGVFAYNAAESDFSNTNITIRSSKLVSYAPGGSALFVRRSGSTGGVVTLDFDVEMYTYGSTLVSGNTLAGVDPVKLEDTENVVVDGVAYEGLYHWTTNEAVIATEVIAEVTNGSDTKQVTNTRDMLALVSATGNTQIKLVKDITCTAELNLPYSCTIDLNGFTITNNTTTALRFSGVGSSNKVATVKNGSLVHKGFAIRVDTGSLDLSGVTMTGVGSNSSVAFYDTNSAYRAGNKIDNCYIHNPKSYAVTWNVADADFSNTGVTITNSTLICPSGYVFGKASNATSGVTTLGEHLEMYGKNTAIGLTAYRYSGLMAGRTDSVSVTVKGTDTTYTLNNWSTDKQTETINVLLLGNSLSTTIPEELYQIAKADGIDLNVTDLYHAGAYGWQHKEWITNASKEYEYRVYNDMGFWFHGDIKTANEAFDYLEWDHVSYQEWINGTARTASVDAAKEAYEVYNDWIYDYLKTKFPNAKLYCYQHWSWQVGHSTVPDTATQTAMFEVIKGVTHYFSDKYEVTLIPCGEAWQLARADSLIGDTMCKADCLHDDGPPGGQYLNGCVFYETMFQKTCIGDTWRASNGPSEAKHIALQQHAHDAVAAVHGENYAK